MKRITPEEVVAAYAKLGAKPAMGTYYEPPDFDDEPDCYCGLGAVIVAGNGGVCPDNFYDAAIDMCGSKGYVNGFIRGFDDLKQKSHWKRQVALGYADGRAAAIAVGLIQEGANT